MKSAAFTRWTQKEGLQWAVGNAHQLLTEVKEHILALVQAGQLPSQLASFSWFTGMERPELTSESSVLLLARSVEGHRIVFHGTRRTVRALLPPLYRYQQPDLYLAPVQELCGEGVEISVLAAPLKALAARLGLVAYGRNNLTYLPHAGSYLALYGYLLSQSPLPLTASAAPRLQEACRNCHACVKACPTAALTSESFLVQTDKCLTLLNERPEQWSAQLPSSLHHCLIGCLRCQEVCPVNRGQLRWEELPSPFTPEEVDGLLAGHLTPEHPGWKRFAEKTAGLGLAGYEEVLGRNLQALG